MANGQFFQLESKEKKKMHAAVGCGQVKKINTGGKGKVRLLGKHNESNKRKGDKEKIGRGK